jgi:hypothetical protein
MLFWISDHYAGRENILLHTRKTVSQDITAIILVLGTLKD